MKAALDELPVQYAERIANLEFFVRRTPSLAERQRLKLGRGSLYGLYEGIPLTHRDSSYDRAFPDRITIFWGPLARDFLEADALAEQVRKTVYHEIGHYFGLSEAELRRTQVE